jgi:hypothetical protein
VYYDYPLAPKAPANMPELFPVMVDAPYGGIPLKPGSSCGGWAVSAVGLARLATAIDGSRLPQILRADSYAHFFDQPPGNPQIWTRDGLVSFNSNRYYGLLAAVDRGSNGMRYLWHNGGIPGTGARLVINRDGLTWAVAFNSTEHPHVIKANLPSAEWELYGEMVAAKKQAQAAIDAANNDLFPAYGY